MFNPWTLHYENYLLHLIDKLHRLKIKGYTEIPVKYCTHSGLNSFLTFGINKNNTALMNVCFWICDSDSNTMKKKRMHMWMKKTNICIYVNEWPLIPRHDIHWKELSQTWKTPTKHVLLKASNTYIVNSLPHLQLHSMFPYL